MTIRITEEQAKRLHTATDAATEPRNCLYLTSNNKPACVIAQLAFMEGVSVTEMTQWCGDIVYVMEKGPGSERLASYPIALLSKLQVLWDGRGIREEMHSTVNGWPR